MEQNKFYNPLKEDFTFRWDKVPYTVKAGETVILNQDWLVRHGAKHLTDYIILHPDLWKELGLTRSDYGDRKNPATGEVINEPDLNAGRKEIEDIILCRVDETKAEEKKADDELRAKALERIDNKKEKINKEFEDLEKLK